MCAVADKSKLIRKLLLAVFDEMSLLSCETVKFKGREM